MARFLGPDMGSRASFLPNGAPASSKVGVIYADAAGTVLADILAYQPGNPTVPGAPIAGSQVGADASGLLTLFWFPDNVRRIWASVNAGPLVPIDAEYGPQIVAVEARVTGVETVGAAHAANVANPHAVTATQVGLGWKWGPSDHGLISWAYEVETATANSVLPLGSLVLVKVKLAAVQTITNVVAHIVTAGATLTAGANFAALFDAAGNRLGVTGDQAASWVTPGRQSMALIAPVVNAAAGIYYVGLLTNGTTSPAFSRSLVGGNPTTIANLGLTGAGLRFATTGAALTAVPASFAPAAVGGTIAAFWAGLS